MNPHYQQGYSDLPSPHSPPPDNSSFHHQHHHPHHGANLGSHMGGGSPLGHMTNGHPHHIHHPFHINNNNNNNGNSNSASPPVVNNNNNNNSVKVCGGCGGKIVERFLLHALDRYWHNGCLKCSCCGAMLADIGSSCFTKAGMILCKNDYVRLFGSAGACSACGQTIPPSEFVMRAGGGGPGGGGASGGLPPHPHSHHVFHLKCFACSKCGAQLVPGDRYYLMAGSLVCEQDWHKLLKSTSVGGGVANANAGGPVGGTIRKGKVGRPRRSRD